MLHGRQEQALGLEPAPALRSRRWGDRRAAAGQAAILMKANVLKTRAVAAQNKKTCVCMRSRSEEGRDPVACLPPPLPWKGFHSSCAFHCGQRQGGSCGSTTAEGKEARVRGGRRKAGRKRGEDSDKEVEVDRHRRVEEFRCCECNRAECCG